MNVKTVIWVTLGVFVALVLVAIGISARFTLTNIISNPYGFIKDFFNQWSPALSAAGTLILAVSVFSFIYENRRHEEIEKSQAIRSLRDEMVWNWSHITTLRWKVNERVKMEESGKELSEPEAPFELIDTRVFDNMRIQGRLHWLGSIVEPVVWNILSCYELIRDYNLDRRFNPRHLMLLAEVEEALKRAIEDLEAKFKNLLTTPSKKEILKNIKHLIKS